MPPLACPGSVAPRQIVILRACGPSARVCWQSTSTPESVTPRAKTSARTGGSLGDGQFSPEHGKAMDL